MKTLYLVLVLGLSIPGCSRFTKTGRMDRAYYKQVKQVKAARERRTKELAKSQRAEAAALRKSPPPLPLERQNVESVTASSN